MDVRFTRRAFVRLSFFERGTGQTDGPALLISEKAPI